MYKEKKIRAKILHVIRDNKASVAWNDPGVEF